MVHRKPISSGSRNSVYPHTRRGMAMGGQLASSSHLPLSHSSPVRQPSKPLRKVQWGNGGHHVHFDESNGRSSSYFCYPRDAKSAPLSDNFGNSNRSLPSMNFDSDGGSILSSPNSAHSKCSSSSSSNNNSKKPVGRPSNPLRYKTELCRSYEESGECRFGSSCTFAHGERERRRVLRHPRYKTDLCRTYHGTGYCQYGARCHFIHDPEEAAGFAGMTGHRLRTCLDGVDMTLLTNLQHLYVCKLMEDKFRVLNTSGYGCDQLNSIETSLESNSASLDMLSIGQDNISGMTSESQPLENVSGIPLNLPDCISANTKSPGRGNQVLRHPHMDGNWWNGDLEYFAKSSVSNLNTMNFSSAHGSETWNPYEVSNGKKSVIGNPMEVSRSLLIPTVSELIHMP